MRYIISSTNPLNEGLEVVGALEEDVEFLNNTFEKLEPKKTNSFGSLRSVSYEMGELYEIRTLKQVCQYKGTGNGIGFFKDIITTKYYSRVSINVLELKNKKEEMIFDGIENYFTNLHMIESSVKDKNGKIISNNYPKYVLNNGHIFSVADYETVIKQALIKLRFQHIYNKKQ